MSEVLKNLLRKKLITQEQYDDVLYAREQKEFVAKHVAENKQANDLQDIREKVAASNFCFVLDKGNAEEQPKATLVLGEPGS